MKKQVKYDFKEESIEAKVRWFRNLTMNERIQNLCDFTELALAINPKLGEKKIDKSIARRIQIITKA